MDPLVEKKRNYLKGLHTIPLLNHLRGLRRLESKWGNDFMFESTPRLLKEEIKLTKEILATREHIPNKKERRKIRQEKAKRKGKNE